MLSQKPSAVTRPQHVGTYDVSPISPPPRVPARPAPLSDTQAVAKLRPVPKKPPSAALPGLMILALGAILFGLSYSRDLLVGEFAAMAMTPLALFGLLRGAIRKVFIIAALIAGVYAGSVLPQILEPQVKRFSPTNAGWVSFAFSALIVLTGIFIVVVFAKRLRRKLEPMPAFYSLDRWLGAVIGAAEGALVVLSICWVSTQVRPHAIRVRDESGEPLSSFRQQLCGGLIRIADEASVGPFGDFVQRSNPIDDVPALRDAVYELNTTGRLNLPGMDPAAMEKLRSLLRSERGDQPPDLNKIIDDLKKSEESQPQAPSSEP